MVGTVNITMDDAFVHFVFVALAAVLVAIETKHKLLPRSVTS